MEGSERWLSPKKSTASPKPSSTGDNDENEMIPRFQNQKKTPSKRFMSPTISASSKVATPQRKKILSERNENINNSDVVQHHKTLDLDKKKSPRNWDSDFSADSFAKAYDPVKNYLSPRPKYLRFNPNRRHEIFNRLEREELNDSSDSQEDNRDEIKDSSLSPRKESEIVKPENEEKVLEGVENNDYEDEEEEEEEDVEIEERGWCIRGLINFVLTLIAGVLSTSYICTMNYPSPTLVQQDIWKVKDGCLMVNNQTLEVVGMKMHEAGFLKMETGDAYDEFEEGGFGNTFSTDEIGEEKNHKIEERVADVEVIESDVENLERVDNGENEGSVDVEVIEVFVESLDKVETDEDENRKHEEMVKVEIDENDVEYLDKVETDNDENREHEEIFEVETVENDVENLEKVDDEVVENESEIRADKIDNDAENKGPDSGRLETKNDHSNQLVDAKNDESVNASSFCLEKEIESSNTALNEDNVEKVGASGSGNEIVTESYELSTGSNTDESSNMALNEDNVEKVGASGSGIEFVTESYELSTGSNTDESDTEVKGLHEKQWRFVPEVGNEKTGRKTTSAVIGFSLVSIILALLGFIAFRLKKKSRNALAEKSEPMLKPHKLASVEEKKKIEFIAKPSLGHSIQEASTKRLDNDHHIYAPAVELIGEIVVGNVSRRKKYEAKSEGSNPEFLPKLGTLTQPVLASTEVSSGHEYSDLSSSSYGSFTTATKILKKEGGGQKGENMIEVTPVRRSSRLRSRGAVVSR